MPVDRRHRDQLAQVLAAHMRERTGAEDLLTHFKRIHNDLAAAPIAEVDRTAIELADDIMMELECGSGGSIGLDTLQGWEMQRRQIALLLSNVSLPSNPTSLPPDHPLARPYQPPRTLVRVLFIAMLLSITAWPWVHGYAFIICWIISPIVWLIVTTEHFGASERTAWPFESEAQWLEHQPLLARLDLPTSWKASPHSRSRMSRSWRRAINALTVALLFFVVYLFMASIWPLMLIVILFMRDAKPRGHDLTAPAQPQAAH